MKQAFNCVTTNLDHTYLYLELLRLDSATAINELYSAIDFKAITLANVSQVSQKAMLTLEDAVDGKRTTGVTSTI